MRKAPTLGELNQDADHALAAIDPVVALPQCLDWPPMLTASASDDLETEQPDPWSVWLQTWQRDSHLLVALLAPHSLAVQFANDAFCRMFGMPLMSKQATLTVPTPNPDWFNALGAAAQRALHRCYRRQVLRHLLPVLGCAEWQDHRWFEVPIVIRLAAGTASERWIQVWLRGHQLQVTPTAELTRSLTDSITSLDHLQTLAADLPLDLCQIEGTLLLEAVDVTETEILRRLTQLLITPESLLQTGKFGRVHQLLRSLFRATDSLIFSPEQNQVRISYWLDRGEWQVTTYDLPTDQFCYFLQAAQTNEVLMVPDLAEDCPSACEQALVEKGMRSLLIIPLVVTASLSGTGASQLAGVIGITSDQPHHFDPLDCQRATLLIPALITAMRSAMQRRFASIHPAVEWKFAQEAERRSWGLPPEPIVFENVYPLYGISDIRGSSTERNRAIQDDLLAQYRLGLTILDAVCQVQKSVLGQQLRLDLLEQIEHLEQGVTVDAEVNAAHYLRDRLEIHFDYFSRCSPESQAAIQTYQAACNNEHGGVYVARAEYDKALHHINNVLRITWDRWQYRMQEITRHYCDIEATDGIDHMIYAGASIDPDFCLFHLQSLRYAQLCAVCDCARTAFRLKDACGTSLEVTHLILVQMTAVDIFHDETTERLFDVKGTRDTRYEIVKKRIDKAADLQTRTRITQPGMLTLVYSSPEEWEEYEQYFHYLIREGWIAPELESGAVEPLQGVTGLKFVRARILPDTLPQSDDIPAIPG